MEYQNVTLRQELNIMNLYTVHYFEYSNDYVFEGEFHDFWELLYVDSGLIEVTTDSKTLTLEKGKIIFHKPNEFHALRANGKSAPNLIVVSFDCNALCMQFFEEKIFIINEVERQYLSHIIAEARSTFFTPLNNPLITRFQRHSTVPFGSEQIIKISLEFLLISLFRRYSETSSAVPTYRVSHSRGNNEKLLEQVILYLSDHVYGNLTVADICRDNMVSRSQLQNVFHHYKGCGVIEYFSRLKIETAKTMIRENHYNYSQIANILNYSSYQYFSLQFKKYTRMSPSEYHSSTKYFHHTDSAENSE